jgi:hypothetical protein
VAKQTASPKILRQQRLRGQIESDGWSLNHAIEGECLPPRTGLIPLPFSCWSLAKEAVQANFARAA